MCDVLLARPVAATPAAAAAGGDAWPGEPSVAAAEGDGSAAVQLRTLAAADAVAAELPEDAAWLRGVLPSAVRVAPIRFVTRARYDPPPPPPPPASGPAGRRGLLFLGSAHGVNADAAVWLATAVLPALRRRLEEAGGAAAAEREGRLTVVGPDMDHVTALRGLPGVHVEGRVRAGEAAGSGGGLDAVAAGCRLFASPAVSGRGSFKTKTLTALSRGLPVLATPAAALGLRRPAAAGHAPLTGVFEAPADAEEYAAAAARLLLDDALWAAASAAAAAFARAHFGPDALLAELRELLAAAEEAHGRGSLSSAALQ
jgi:glycosyltransferase involved in cell wall biosynthesis